MIDVGIAGPLGQLLAWLTAALFLISLGFGARVGWTAVHRGLCRASVRIGGIVLLLAVGLGASVAHFWRAPQTVEVSRSGDWTARSAYGNQLWRVPAEEDRQVRLVSAADQPLAHLQVRRASGQQVVLYGHHLASRLGYRWNMCGAWQERPVWRPHQYRPGGPDCADAPWPAALNRLEGAPLARR